MFGKSLSNGNVEYFAGCFLHPKISSGARYDIDCACASTAPALFLYSKLHPKHKQTRSEILPKNNNTVNSKSGLSSSNRTGGDLPITAGDLILPTPNILVAIKL